MCENKYKNIWVKIPADLSYLGEVYEKLVLIDECIADIVHSLQDGGIDMRGSCCGHGKRDGHIALQDGRILVIKQDGQKYLSELK